MGFREHLPQLDGGMFVTDGGIETYLMFQRGLELPEFAAFDLLKDDRGRRELRDYYANYLGIASEHRTSFILESPTWRANPAWAEKIGYDGDALARANTAAIELLSELRDERSDSIAGEIVISGCVGPQDDGYSPTRTMTLGEAAGYHSPQIRSFAAAGADMATAITMTYVEEAAGVAQAAAAAGLPSAISFTVETDGRLPSGQPLDEAIAQLDAETGGAPAYYMLNCAHPTHFEAVLEPGAGWLDRIRGLRANASTASHAELDEATELDDGDPADLGERYAALRERIPQLNVLGGCCGTDHRHVAAIWERCLS